MKLRYDSTGSSTAPRNKAGRKKKKIAHERNACPAAAAAASASSGQGSAGASAQECAGATAPAQVSSERKGGAQLASAEASGSVHSIPPRGLVHSWELKSSSAPADELRSQAPSIRSGSSQVAPGNPSREPCDKRERVQALEAALKVCICCCEGVTGCFEGGRGSFEGIRGCKEQIHKDSRNVTRLKEIADKKKQGSQRHL